MHSTPLDSTSSSSFYCFHQHCIAVTYHPASRQVLSTKIFRVLRAKESVLILISEPSLNNVEGSGVCRQIDSKRIPSHPILMLPGRCVTSKLSAAAGAGDDSDSSCGHLFQCRQVPSGPWPGQEFRSQEMCAPPSDCAIIVMTQPLLMPHADVS